MMKLTIQEGPRAFHSPCHDRDMALVSYGAEPNTGETYGVWRCRTCDRIWLESEKATEWEEWDKGK
jgi:hypothetical protein